MKKVHVECLPDETLVKQLGITRKMVTHHTGKSRVFNQMKTSRNEVALVDEDPVSAKTEYERNLKLEEELYGIKRYSDKHGNKVLILRAKLEDWLISVCVEATIDITKFGLPQSSNELHDVINQRLIGLQKLIAHLKKINNPALIQLQDWLN
jgi:hypothetical protein